MYLAIDTEHGGFDENNDALTLLELSFILYGDDWKEQHSKTWKCIPDDGILNVTGEALAVNRIDLIEHAKIAQPFKEVKKEVGAYLNQFSDTGKNRLTPVGHSVFGDIQLICRDLINRKTWHLFCNRRFLDTQQTTQYLRAKGQLDKSVAGSLGALCKHYDVELLNAHTSLADARASAMLMKKLLEI